MKDTIKRIRNEREGFTLAELLIVVAIIAVLVAIAIPVFSTQLEKSREATDAANIRAAYAEVMTAALTEADDDADGVQRSGDAGSYVWTKTVSATQTQTGWQDTSIENIGGVAITGITATSLKGWTVTYTQNTGAVTFVEATA